MARSRRRYELRHPELNRLVDELVERTEEVYGPSTCSDEIRQILVSALRLARDGADRGDVKLVNNALKELRHAFRVFEPYRNHRKVAVFGSARTTPAQPEYEAARVFAERVVREGWMVITGAGGGIMGAAQGGAGRERSFGVNIRLPFEQSANEVIAGDPKLINFRYFFTRKVSFVKEAHAIALFPGGFGTHDEGFEALTLIQTGKSEILPVVFVDARGGSYWKDWEQYVHSHLHRGGLISDEDLSLFKVTDDVEVAVREVTDFYRNYHSSRYRGDRLHLRVRVAPDPAQLEDLADRFGDICTQGSLELTRADLLDEPTGESLPAVSLRFDRRSVGRLRQLIDELNRMVPERPVEPVPAIPHEIWPRELSPEDEAEEQDEEGPPPTVRRGAGPGRRSRRGPRRAP
ncbi:MAG: LOG family protein [Myxococcota bacterium]